MNPEAQRIAIATSCGWDFDPAEAWRWVSRGQWCKRPDSDELWFRSHVPDYLHDLNAMHDAEKVLRKVMGGNDSDAIIANRMTQYAELIDYAIDATAPQRAEAFLRTLGKWEKSE